ncbi:MAG TPA: GatB/YqeY domain-containing protein [Candidatus Saccharimonadales bacterium]|nr:GatB/YqeY domain-containing protein [Candidatus Saccharimonadales bacterium]
MILIELQSKLIAAQKAKDELRLSVLRYLLAGIKNKEIELRPLKQELTDEVILAVLKKQIKKHGEAIEDFKRANRQDLIDNESAQLEVLNQLQNEFAPQQA